MATTALMTASYHADYERCRLLCDSTDMHVSGASHHYILVDSDDYALFRSLDGPGRTVVNEADLLPKWLRTMRGNVLTDNRNIWWSTKTWPMRGWHVQQLRRIAMAFHTDAEALVSCDSDMLFVRPFQLSDLWRDGALRLYRKNGAIDAEMAEHVRWCRNAAGLFGLAKPELPASDHIGNIVSWRTSEVRAMCAAIEDQTGRDWVSAIGRDRTFSECQIYGAWMESVRKDEGAWTSELPLCRVYWQGKALNLASMRNFVASMEPQQVAVGFQSFTGSSPDAARALLESRE